jgi:hypothetical protein
MPAGASERDVSHRRGDTAENITCGALLWSQTRAIAVSYLSGK